MISTIKALLPQALVAQHLRRLGPPYALLTFDDGPHPEVTPQVLDRLDKFDARAIFFVIGRRIKRAPHLISEIVSRGHGVGNHTYLHRRSDVNGRPSLSRFYLDAKRCQVALERHGINRAQVFRPPGGRLTPVTLLVPRLLGMQCVTWSLDVGDWAFRRNEDVQHGADRLLRSITSGDIVLLHDDNPSLLDLLDIVLPELKRKGWDLASGVDQLTTNRS